MVDMVSMVHCRLLDAYGIWLDPEEEDSSCGSSIYGGRRPQSVTGAEQILRSIQVRHGIRLPYAAFLLWSYARSAYSTGHSSRIVC